MDRINLAQEGVQWLLKSGENDFRFFITGWLFLDEQGYC
jgi:hypothetical protein